MKNYISVNIVSQALLLMRAISKNSCFSEAEIKQLKVPYGVNVNSSTAFALQCNWLIDVGGALSFSDTGTLIEHLFNGESISQELWKIILNSYIAECKPAWSRRIPYGRKEAFLFMNEEEQRCFLEAGLMDSFQDDVLKWWDTIAEAERLKENAMLDDIGRAGEKLTLKYEEARTGVIPDWRSIETNLSGYDILSQFSANDTRRLLIEVKSSTKPPEIAEAIISRHEWDTANLENNYSRYLFYFWYLGGDFNRLAIINVEELKKHIPQDGESGKWTAVSVPFVVFSERFTTWN